MLEAGRKFTNLNVQGRSGTLGAGWTLEAGRELTNGQGRTLLDAGRSGMLEAGRGFTNLNVQGRTLLEKGSP